MSKKIIMVDVDSVLLNWGANLPFYSREKGIDPTVIDQMVVDHVYRKCIDIFGVDTYEHAREIMYDYHASHFGRTMPAYIDAIEVISRLKKKFDFVAVTAVGTDPVIVDNRRYNLETLFPDAFIDIYCVEDTKLHAFYNIDAKYGDRVIAFVDDRHDYISECRRVFGRNQVKTFQMCRGAQTPTPSNHIDMHVSHWGAIENTIERKVVPTEPVYSVNYRYKAV